MTQEFSATLSGVDGDFAITEEGGHQEAGSIRRYNDNNIMFYYYFHVNKNKTADAVDIVVHDISSERMAGWNFVLPLMRKKSIEHNIVNSFQNRSIAQIQKPSTMQIKASVKFDWKA